MGQFLEKLQQKTTNILGPLSKVWYAIEKARDSSQDKVEISMKELTNSLEQSVMLTGKLITLYHITEGPIF